MLIGIVGAPNKGKSTIFSALTLVEAEIADYPFTTIDPNIGVAYATRPCVDRELGVKCKPRNSLCVNGIRHIPINVIDVAGLVPGAHLGKGRGNQFLNDLMNADAIVQVVDISGKTDISGSRASYSDPYEEVRMVRDEMSRWLGGIILKHSGTLARRPDGDKALEEFLSGFKVTLDHIQKAASERSLVLSNIKWGEKEANKFAESLLRISKPMIIAANKLDQAKPEDVDKLRKRLDGIIVIGCSGAIELTLRKAAKSGAISYVPGSAEFVTGEGISQEQSRALSYVSGYIKAHGGTGIQELLNTAVFSVLMNIVVYPVEDENKYSDHFGNILPDAVLMQDGSTAQDLAARIHTDIAKGMKYAIDARTKLRLQKTYQLKDNDVIKIVTTAK
ncbi:MAG: YchF-related putative GTPase [Candidatus Micrarchaeota archaeon]|nr:YchF-related putative GTPase [Candidatus Micrarchaeota archaeon]